MQCASLTVPRRDTGARAWRVVKAPSIRPASFCSRTGRRRALTDGQPDLQGVWLIHTATPLERPKALEGKARLTDEEVAEFRRRAASSLQVRRQRFRRRRRRLSSGANQSGKVHQPELDPRRRRHDRSRVRQPNAHSSTNPQDGRIPALTPEGRNRQSPRTTAFRRTRLSPADVGNALRCLSWGVPRLGGRYGSGDMSYYQNHSESRLRRAVHGNRARGAHHPDRWQPAPGADHPAVERRLARPLGGRHARRRHDQLLPEQLLHGIDRASCTSSNASRALRPTRSPTR